MMRYLLRTYESLDNSTITTSRSPRISHSLLHFPIPSSYRPNIFISPLLPSPSPAHEPEHNPRPATSGSRHPLCWLSGLCDSNTTMPLVTSRPHLLPQYRLSPLHFSSTGTRLRSEMLVLLTLHSLAFSRVPFVSLHLCRPGGSQKAALAQATSLAYVGANKRNSLLLPVFPVPCTDSTSTNTSSQPASLTFRVEVGSWGPISILIERSVRR